MAINQNWKLGRRSAKCHHEGRAFSDGEMIVTAILPVAESEDYERRDYSAEAWEEVKAEVLPFSFWRSRFEVRETEEKTDVISEKESAEALLRRLIEEDDPRTENARYVLAVMLERKRTLKEVERKDAENGSRLLIYEHPKTGDVLIVRDPMLRLDEIEPVQAEVSALLAPKPAAEAAAGEVDAGGEEREVAAEADEGKKSPAEGAGGVEN